MKERFALLAAYFKEKLAIGKKSGKEKRKSMILSIVALVEVLAIAIVSVSAWVETISTIKLDLNNGTIDNYVFTNANIGYGNGYDGKTIDLTKYFRQAGDVHLASATSANGSVIEGSNSAGATHTFTGITSESGREIPLYAIWKINSYSVSYQTNSGSWAEDEGEPTLELEYGAVINADGNEESKIPDITRTGYTFGGWYTDPNFSENSRVHTMPAYSVTLYAQWIPNDYQVNFHYGNTSATSESLDSYAGSSESRSFEYGDAIAFNNANVDHYTFVWYMYANSSVELFRHTTMPDLSSTEFSSFVTTTEPGENGTFVYTINLYAVYTAVEYSINYQGGYNSTKVTAANTAESKLTSANASTGYEFLGWTIGGGETTYSYYAVGENAGVKGVYFRTDAGEFANQHFVAFTDLENIVLVPYFPPIEYTFTLNADGGTLGSESRTINVTFGEYYGQLPTPTRNGYTFLGWYTAQENGILIGSTTTLTTGTLPSNVSDSAKKGTLYARWEESTYTITYVLNGGSWVEGNPTVTEYTYGTGATLPDGSALTAPTGYTFAGWYDAETGGNPVTAIGASEYGNKTFYARWTANSYTIAFSGDHVTNSDGTLTYDQDYTVIISAEGGYDVAGVTIAYTDASSETIDTDAYSLVGNVLTIKKNRITGNITVTVTTKPHTYTVTLDGTNVSAAADSTFTATHGTEYTLKLTPNEGYSLLPDSVTVTMGGSTLTAGDGYTYEDGKITITSVTGNIVITAKGQVESYAVNVSPSGESQNFTVDGTTGDNVRAYDQSYTVTFTANGGYTITGIAVSADGVGLTENTDYTINLSNGTVTIFANRVAADVTITVTTKAITYTVVFDLNGGSGENVTVKNVAYHTTLGNVSDKPAPTRDGYEFLGWATTATATEQLSDDTVISADATYYAVWQAAEYTVTVSGDNLAGNTSDPAKLTHDQQYTITINAEAGYRITEYSVTMGNDGTVTPVASYSDDNGTLTLTFAAYTVTGNITITITTAVRQYTVTFDSNGGTTVASVTVDHGGTVTKPTDPTRTGYTFDVWYLDNEAYDFDTLVTGNLTLVAHWTANAYDVTVSGDNNNVSYDSEQVGSDKIMHNAEYTIAISANSGYRITEISVTMGGTTYSGYRLSDGTLTFAAYTVTGDIVITVNTIAQYTVSFDLNGNGDGVSGSAPSDMTVDAGTKIILPSGEGIVRNGYTFIGWNTNKEATAGLTSYTVTETEILYAIWQANTYTVTLTLTFPSAATAQIVNERMQALGTLALAGMSTSLSSNAERGYIITVTVTAAYGTSLKALTDLLSDDGFKKFVVGEITYTLSYDSIPATMPVVTEENGTYSGEWTWWQPAFFLLLSYPCWRIHLRGSLKRRSLCS